MVEQIQSPHGREAKDREGKAGVPRSPSRACPSYLRASPREGSGSGNRMMGTTTPLSSCSCRDQISFLSVPSLPLTVCKPNESNGVMVFNAMFRRGLREIKRKKKFREGPDYSSTKRESPRLWTEAMETSPRGWWEPPCVSQALRVGLICFSHGEQLFKRSGALMSTDLYFSNNMTHKASILLHLVSSRETAICPLSGRKIG